jgi:hypothetical protein
LLAITIFAGNILSVSAVIAAPVEIDADPVVEHSAAAPIMAGLTYLTGSVSGYADVVVPPGAGLSFELTRDASGVDGIHALADVEGEGRLVGFALESRDQSPDGRLDAIAVRLPETVDGLHSVGFASAPTPGGQGLDEDRVFCNVERCSVPAGDYRLYLIADNSPVTVAIRLDGLTGTQALTPTSTVRSSQEVLGESAALTPVAGVWYGGVAGTLENTGRIVGVTWAVSAHPRPTVASWGRCFYEGDGHEDVGAYAPGCPGARIYHLGGATLSFGRTSSVSIDTLRNVPAGRYGVGGHATHLGSTVARGGAAGLWLETEQLP